MKRRTDPARFSAWVNDPTTEEMLEASRDALVAALERPPTDPQFELGTERGDRHALEIVRRLRTLGAIRASVRGAKSMEQAVAKLASPDTEDHAEGEADA